jgi:hypothetical protein
MSAVRCELGEAWVPQIMDMASIQALVPNGLEAWMDGVAEWGRFPAPAPLL